MCFSRNMTHGLNWEALGGEMIKNTLSQMNSRLVVTTDWVPKLNNSLVSVGNAKTRWVLTWKTSRLSSMVTDPRGILSWRFILCIYTWFYFQFKWSIGQSPCLMSTSFISSRADSESRWDQSSDCEKSWISNCKSADTRILKATHADHFLKQHVGFSDWWMRFSCLPGSH